MEGAALMSWIATAGAGLTLIATWLERGGLRTRGLRRLSRFTLPVAAALVVALIASAAALARTPARHHEHGKPERVKVTHAATG
ncbi:MAG TPA: hypothetical protein VGI54_12295, partial [Solirubrobacteraceae bacterium]